MNDNGGWICLFRKFTNWEWYQDTNVKVVFLHLLLTVNHKDMKWRGTVIKRGQKLTSISHLASETGLTVRQVRTALDKLKMTNEITIKTTNKNTLINIEKYSVYQDKEKENDKQNGKQLDNQTTIERQTNDKQTTTNNNENNITMITNNNSNSSISDSCVDGLEVNDSCVDGLQDVIDFYNNNIGMITPFGADILADYTKEMGKDIVIYAMQISVEANKRTIQYIKGILNSWKKKGIKTLLEAKEESNYSKKNNAKNENYTTATTYTDWGSMYDEIMKGDSNNDK